MATSAITRTLYAGGAELRRVASATIRRLCEIPEAMTVTEFADRFRVLPETSSNPGPYDSSVVPYVRRAQDLMGDPSVTMNVLCWGSQLTKSTCIENSWMYRVCRMPTTMVIVQPKIDAAESWSKERLRPMIRVTPILRKRVRLDRGSEATLRFLRYPGGITFIASAQSATELAMRSSSFIYLDEVDRMEIIPGEGNPVEIVLRRQGAGDIGLAVLTSTPRDAETTIIWPYLENGSHELYCVPCPHCGMRQPLIWSNLRWDRENRGSAHYVCPSPEVTRKFLEGFEKLERERRTARLAVDTASGHTVIDEKDDARGEETWRAPLLMRDRFAAGGCGAVIEEVDKPKMLAAGQWMATNPEAEYPSSHLNSLYSPFAKSSWAVLAGEWERSVGKPADHQVFINTRLAELWEEKTEAHDPNALQNRREHELDEGVVPAGVGAITMGFDVQDNRIEGYVWGWGAGLESWPIASIIIPGDPQREADHGGSIWGAVDEFRRQLWPHEDSGGVAFIAPAIVFVDSGDAATQVYRFTNARKGERVFACKGEGGPAELLKKPTLQGREKVVLYSVGVDAAKNEFIRSQLLEQKRGPGFVHIPGWFTEQQCQQLVAEKRRREIQRGRVVYVWKKKKGQDANEALDCRNYARAALEALGTKAIAMLGDAAAQITQQAKLLATAGKAPATPPAGSGKGRMISRGLPRDH